MPAKRINPNLLKLHRSYTVGELASVLGVHKNSVRQWQQSGLRPVDSGRPALFQGAEVKAFLRQRNASRKRPWPPGTLYCLRCREARAPALGMVDYLPLSAASGNIRALCATCETMMHRRCRRTALGSVMPGMSIHMPEAEPRLSERPNPSANCDKERQTAA